MSIAQIINTIAADSRCRVLPPEGLPVLTADLALPDDLAGFYRRCGGVDLFPDGRFGFSIVRPADCLPANPVILGDYYANHQSEIDVDQSACWYIIGRGKDPVQFITISLAKGKTNGYCHDAFWEVYATANSKIIAKSFAELLERLYAVGGTDIYWEHPGFDLGHAYD